MKIRRFLVLLLILFMAVGCEHCEDDDDPSDGADAGVDSGGPAPTDVGPDPDSGDMGGTGSCGGATCTGSEVCFNDLCYPACSEMTPCASGECFDGRCAATACEGVTCATDELCEGGRCVVACSQPSDCPTGETCFEGRYCSVDACDSVSCPLGEVCYAGSCYDPCVSDGDCTPPNICYDGRCAVDACDGVACPLGEVCFGGTCAGTCGQTTTCSTNTDCTGADETCQGINAATGLGRCVACDAGESCYVDGCTADTDCAAGEYCFIPGGSLSGACLAAGCDPLGSPACSTGALTCRLSGCDGVQCPLGEVCYEGSCYDSCSADGDCTPPNICYDGRCAFDPCDDVWCPLGEICYGGACFDPCTSNVECSSPDVCTDGRCTETACSNVQCGTDQTCFEGSCYDTCVDDGDCTPPNACFNALCSEDPCAGVACPLGESCYAGSCYNSCTDDGDCTPPNSCYNALCSQDACIGAACPAGQTCTCAGITPGVSGNGSIGSAGETGLFRFNAEEGELLTVRTQSTTFAGDMVVLDPTGSSLDTIAFTTSADAWLPFRAPITGTYTVEVSSTSATGTFITTVESYGLESAMDPTLFTGSAPNGGITDFYFFAQPGEVVVADAVLDPTGAFTNATATLQELLPDETWGDTLMTVGTEPVSASVGNETAALLAGSAASRSIYRLSVNRAFGTADMTIRMDKMMPSANNTVRVDSNGMCTGYEASIPRLASLTIVPGGTIEICEGDHLEYGTLRVGPGAAGEIRGLGSVANPSTLVAGGAPRFSPAPLPAFLADSASGSVVADLEITTTMGTLDSDRPIVGFGTSTSTNVTIDNLTVAMGISATGRFFDGFFPQNGLTVRNSKFSESVSFGLLFGDDITMEGLEIATGATDTLTEFFVDGDRFTFADSVVGSSANGVASSLSVRGDDMAITGNEIYTISRLSVGENARQSNTLVDSNLFVTTASTGDYLVQLKNIDNLTFSNNDIDDAGSSIFNATLLIQESSGAVFNNRVEVFERDVVELANTYTNTNDLPIDFMNNTFVITSTNATARVTVVDIDNQAVNMLALPISLANNIFVNSVSPSNTNQSAMCSTNLLFDMQHNLYENFVNPPCTTDAVPVQSSDYVGPALLDASLKLTAASPAINAGRPSKAPATDFEGDARGAGAPPFDIYDIGADEF